MKVFLAHWGNPWISSAFHSLWKHLHPKAHSLLSALSGWLFAMNSQSCNLLSLLISVQCYNNYMISLHNSQMDSVCVWKGVISMKWCSLERTEASCYVPRQLSHWI